jgi:hypothetical protein
MMGESNMAIRSIMKKNGKMYDKKAQDRTRVERSCGKKVWE